MMLLNKKNWLPLLICVILTLICFYPSLGNEFQILWDDDDYLLKNPYIRSLSFESILRIFSVILSGNYHPITLLSNAIEYNFFGLNPFVYHLDNLLIHLMNVGLVYGFFLLFSGRISMAFFIALIFGIHPMHVESVAWLSERKDLLYSFFFLISMISYLAYLRKKNRILIYLSFVAFVLSVLSKSAGIALPLILILIDMMEGKKLSFSIFKKKWLFFLLSFIFGILAIYTQKITGAIQSYPQFNFFERCLFIVYGYGFYLWKFFLPTNLSALHLYPPKINAWLPFQYYIVPILTITSIAFIFLIKKLRKEIFFGLLFYTLCIGLVLQMLPLGPSLVSERFSYLPYLGVSYSIYIIFIGIYEYFFEKKKKFTIALLGCAGLIAISALGYLSYERSKIWNNSYILIEDALSKNHTGEYSFWMQGNLDFHQKNYISAIENFNRLIELKPDYADAYHNRGYTKFFLKDFTGAISDYTMAIAKGVKGINTYIDRGYAHFMLKDYTAAMKDYNLAIRKDPFKPETYYYRGDIKSIQKDSLGAIEDFNWAIKIKADYIEAYASRGMLFYKLKNFAAAEKDFSFLLGLKPEMIELHNFRGVCLMKAGNFSAAMQDFHEVIQARPEYSDAYINRGLLKQKTGSKNGACEDWKRALALQNKDALSLIKQFCNN